MRLDGFSENLMDTIFYVIKKENGTYDLCHEPNSLVPWIVNSISIIYNNKRSLPVPAIKGAIEEIIKKQDDTGLYLQRLCAEYDKDNSKNIEFYIVGLQFEGAYMMNKFCRDIERYEKYFVSWFTKADLLRPDNLCCFSIEKVMKKLPDSLMDNEMMKLNDVFNLILQAKNINELNNVMHNNKGFIYTAVRIVLEDTIDRTLKVAIANPLVLKQ